MAPQQALEPALPPSPHFQSPRPMNRLQTISSLVLLGLATTSLASAQTFTLEPSADGTLYEDFFGDLANGAGGSAYVGDNSATEIRRAVMQFDLSVLPPNATVSSATLEITVQQVSPGGPPTRMLLVHRVTQDWSEGSSDAGDPGGGGISSETDDATWLHRSYPGTLWNTPGGDFFNTPSLGQTIDFPTRLQLSSPEMVADVQGWVDNPGTSHGWLLKMLDEANNTAIRIGTKEALVLADRPKLIITVQDLSYFCDPNEPNSTGLPTRLVAGFGFSSGSGLHLEAYDGPPNQFGYFLVGTGVNDPGIPLGSGRFCLATGAGQSFGRYNVSGTALDSIGLFDATGRLQNVVGTSTAGTGFDVPSAVPLPGNPTIMAGSEYHFQLWHREDNGGSNFSRGATILF